jgi:hypothetical protein
MFDSLVENAIDSMEVSLRELMGNPGYWCICMTDSILLHKQFYSASSAQNKIRSTSLLNLKWKISVEDKKLIIR